MQNSNSASPYRARHIQRAPEELLLAPAVGFEHPQLSATQPDSAVSGDCDASRCARASQPLPTAQSPTMEPYIPASVRAIRTAPTWSPAAR